MHRDILTAGQNWAAAAHVGLIHNGHPTRIHLEDVVRTMLEFDTVPGHQTYEDTVVAAWMHDTLRYTDTTAAEIGRTLGGRVAGIVRLTTDPGAKGPTRTPEERRESKRLAYAQFMAETDSSIRREAGFIRCVDRFVNMRTAVEQGVTRKIEAYRDEMPDFLRVYGMVLIDPARPHRQRLWDEIIHLGTRLPAPPIVALQ